MASGVLLLAMVWMFFDDYSREWKSYQKQFRGLEIEKTRVKYDLASHDLEKNTSYQELRKQLEEAQKGTQSKVDELKQIEKQIEKLRAGNELIKQKSRFAKAEYDSAKFLYEDAVGHHENPQDIAQAKRVFDDLSQKVADLRSQEESSDRELNELTRKVKDSSQDIKKLEREQKTLSRQVDIAKRKLDRIDPQEMTTANRFADIVRDLPVIDLANPNLKIEQVVLKDLTDNVNFMQVPKADRCVTCHQGSTNPEYKEAPQPFTTHPNLELFLASDSAHPLEEFGCTTCHGGRGRGTDFNSAGHTPSTQQEAKEWEEKYKWHPIHHWETPMYPSQYVEAGCFKCHAGQEVIKGAEKLNLGMQLVEKAGCYACHNIDKYTGWPKPGPDLSRLASKTSKKWAYQWIKNPHDFRHNTWMPAFFGQSNNNDPQSLARTDQEIHAIVHYLFAHSQEPQYKEIPVQGDSKKGEELVSSLGCFGCHDMEQKPQNQKTTRDTLLREFGPNLTGMGAKTSKSWLYNWLKNPQGFSHTTRMPNLRLSDEEAADIAAFLMTDKDQGFSATDIPVIDENRLNAIIRDFLLKMTGVKETEQKIAQMSLEEKFDFAGQKLIRHYGCFGCHQIPGFENEKPIGTDLTEWGSKTAHGLDFGFIPIPHSSAAFAVQKLKDPRIFDKDRVREPNEKLRMPNFHFTEEEIEAVTTFLLGLVKDKPAPSKMVSRTPKNLFIEEGQKVVRQFNCQGCHVIENQGGAIAPMVTKWLVDFGGNSQTEAEAVGLSFSPPNLIGEGKKVHPEWLFAFLHKPETIRPWLKVRMPTFHFTTEDINSFVKYFNYLDAEPFPFTESPEIKMTPDELAAGERLFSKDYFSCAQCHIVGNKFPGGTPDRWAPNFDLAKKRLKPKWLFEWIKNPTALMPGTKMPTFYDPGSFNSAGPEDVLGGDENEQIRVLRDYIMTISDHLSLEDEKSAITPTAPVEPKTEETLVK